MTLKVTNPIKLAIEKEKELKAIRLGMKLKTNRLASQVLERRSSAHSSGQSRDQNNHPTMDLNRSRKYEFNSLQPSRRTSPKQASNAEIPCNYLGSEVLEELKSDAVSRDRRENGKSSPSDSTANKLKQRLNDQKQADALDQHISSLKRRSNSHAAFLDVSSLNLNGKSAASSTFIKNADPFEGLRPFAISQLKQNNLEPSYTLVRSNAAQAIIPRESFNTTHKRSHSTANLTHKTVPNSLSFHINPADVNCQMDGPAQSLGRGDAIRDINQRSCANVSRIAAVKPRFNLHALTLREHRSEANQVKSLLNAKRLGIDKS